MSNYIEYKNKAAFHPGYYIEELVDDSGLTQQDFAKRLDTTPKTLSKLINGQQRLTPDMASKLSKMLGTSMDYWLNLQNAYDTVLLEIDSAKNLENEEAVLKSIGYGYFRDNFGLPDFPRRLSDQVAAVRSFLEIASLTVLTKPDLSISFRSSMDNMDGRTVAKANAMTQIAINFARKVDAPQYDKSKFELAVHEALGQTTNHGGFFPLVRQAFLEAGVILVVLPNLSGSKTNGATKKLGSNVMLMVNDRRLYADSFWFTLLHEAGHILNDDLGISFEHDSGAKEERADRFAADALIDPNEYADFVMRGDFSLTAVKSFASEITRDPGIVLGRLQNDGLVRHGDRRLASLRRRYKVVAEDK